MADTLVAAAAQAGVPSVDQPGILGDLLKKKFSFDSIPIPEDWKGWFAYHALKVRCFLIFRGSHFSEVVWLAPTSKLRQPPSNSILWNEFFEKVSLAEGK